MSQSDRYFCPSLLVVSCSAGEREVQIFARTVERAVEKSVEPTGALTVERTVARTVVRTVAWIVPRTVVDNC